MNEKLDNELCTKYPKIFKQRGWSMRETAMCWGFEHGDGWYNILDKLCLHMQHRIDTSRENRASALRYNRALKKAIEQLDVKPLVKFYNKEVNAIHELKPWAQKLVLEDIERNKLREVPEVIPQVVAVQVKEKFGTLRFYTVGGNDIFYAMISLAESLSGVTCETCGAPGKRRGNGWIYTACDAHTKEDDLNSDTEENTL